jgi:peptidoglycan/xylan/chitin deacetylase (PgdA/CDA1 family)
VDAGSVPSDLVEGICSAVRGDPGAATDTPALERRIRAYGEELTKSVVDSRGFSLWKERWPGGAAYAACLTHDVDNVSRPISHIIARRRRFSTADLLLALLGLKELYDNIAMFSELEGARGLHSSFYLLCFNYDLAAKSAQLNRLAERGWDVGIHGDFGTHDSGEKMAEALAKFKAATGISPVGIREHYLRFDYGLTWEIMEGAGLSYDTTVGNTDSLGYRVGLCTPFRPPDRDWKPRAILELPLTVMDATLWGYLRRSEPDGLRDLARMKEEVSGVKGLFTLLWHTEAARMKGGRLYPDILDGLVRDRCHVGSGAEISGWWKARAGRLSLQGKTYRMDDAPSGLVLRFKAKGGERIDCKGGMASEGGDGVSVKAAGGPLSVEVS